MIKLVEALNTRYLTTNWCSDVINFTNSEDVIDVAGARICRDVMLQLMLASYQHRCEIIDTEDPDRSAFFAENARRGAVRDAAANLTRVPLPVPDDPEDVVQSIKTLDADTVYYIRQSKDLVEISYAVLVQMARPEIQIHLDSAVPCMFRHISEALYPNSHRWEEFYMLTDPTFIVVSVGNNDYTEFISGNIVVPTEFGRECLVQKPEWEGCLNRMLRTFQENFKPSGRHIQDYL